MTYRDGFRDGVLAYRSGEQHNMLGRTEDYVRGYHDGVSAAGNDPTWSIGV